MIGTIVPILGWDGTDGPVLPFGSNKDYSTRLGIHNRNYDKGKNAAEEDNKVNYPKPQSEHCRRSIGNGTYALPHAFQFIHS